MATSKKAQFMAATGKDEAAYYAHSRKVCEKRHFNIKTSQLLAAYGWNPFAFLSSQSAEVPEDLQEKDLLQWMVQDCSCPMTILRTYVREFFNEDHLQTLEYQIAVNLRKFPEASFRRFGDANQVDKKFYQVYCMDGAETIDVQAMMMTETIGREVTEEDIVSFVIAYPKGTHTYKPVPWADKLGQRFYELTGMRLTYDYAKMLLERLENRDENEEEVPF